MKLGPCLVLTILTCWLLKRLWEAERHHQSLATKLVHNTHLVNESIKRENKSKEVNNKVSHCQILPTATWLWLNKQMFTSSAVNNLLSFRFSFSKRLNFYHMEFILLQVSVTQQLEMRHLNSAMAQEPNVQIIVTEPSVTLDQDHASQKSVKARTTHQKTSDIQVKILFRHNIHHNIVL